MSYHRLNGCFGMSATDASFRELMEQAFEARGQVFRVWCEIKYLPDSPTRDHLWIVAEEAASATARLFDALLLQAEIDSGLRKVE